MKEFICKPNPESDLALKPCPFCGCDEVVYVQYEHAAGLRWKVFCPNCTASIDPGWAQSKTVVRDMWGRRV